jgi:hypothetical protein
MVLDPLKMMNMEVGPRLQEMQRAFMATGRATLSPDASGSVYGSRGMMTI